MAVLVVPLDDAREVTRMPIQTEREYSDARQIVPEGILRAVVAVAVGSMTASSIAAQKPARPNVLLILADDLGFSDLGSYGGELRTPALDAIARDGIRYSQFYTSARCCPSRASLLTGLHPHRAGIGSFTTRDPDPNRSDAYTGHLLDSTATLAEILKTSGYSTWMVGKWHLGTPGPIERGFDQYYGYKNFEAHSEGQWNPDNYVRLPESSRPEVSTPRDAFYVTDIFTDYTLEFLKQARNEPDKPWFVYLAHSSPHFPLQAPKQSIDRNMEMYRRGWDVLRAERFEKMKSMGMVTADATLPPRAIVPVDRHDIANGYAGRPNPAWADLPADRREDLARRMATYAAMVEHVDTGIGKIVDDLKANGEYENTIILFLSDNGACYEWGPFGFDEHSRKGVTTLHTGEMLDRMGQRGTYHSGGSGWAMLSNTPLSLYKHFCHEGGIASPLIVRYPGKTTRPGRWVNDPAHLMDIVPTICELTGATYPAERAGHAVRPAEGISLVPTLREEHLAERAIPFDHQGAHALRKGDWKLVRGKRQGAPAEWELYHLATDRMEQHDVAAQHPERVKAMADEWLKWATEVGVDLSIKEGS